MQPQYKEEKMKKTIITVVGRDTVGIIARVCNYLAENQVNIEDISQTIVQGYFNMMMVTDTSKSSKSGGELAEDLKKLGGVLCIYVAIGQKASSIARVAEDLKKLGEEIGVVIRCQHEDIFNMMHRI